MWGKIVDRVRHPLWLSIMFGIMLTLSGMCANSLVCSSNGGKMPVAMNEGDLLFSVATSDPRNMKFMFIPFDQLHAPLRADSRWRLLADRIYVKNWWVPPTWPALRFVLAKFHFPIDGEGRFISIGDIATWLGLFTMLTFGLVGLAIFVFRIIMHKKWFHPL